MSYYYLSSRLLYEPQRSRLNKLGGKLLSLLLRNDRPQHLDSLLLSSKPCPPYPTAGFQKSLSNKRASGALSMGKATSPPRSSLPPLLKLKSGSHDLFGNSWRGGHPSRHADSGSSWKWGRGNTRLPGTATLWNEHPVMAEARVSVQLESSTDALSLAQTPL